MRARKWRVRWVVVALVGAWVMGGTRAGARQAARPEDTRAYTHKLDLDLIAHVHAFAWTPAWSYLHRVSAYAILDYVASGLPKAGDEVPAGRLFVSDARPLALITGVALPVSPPDQ